MEIHKCVCRLCLIEIDPEKVFLLNINQHLIKSVLLIIGIEVAQNASYYEYLCIQCRSELEQCVQFRTTCIQNDAIFRKMFFETNTDEKLSPDPVHLEGIEMEFLKVEMDDDAYEGQSNSDPQDDQAVTDLPADAENNDTNEKSDQEVEKAKKPPKKKRKTRKRKADGDVPKIKAPRCSPKVQCQQCGAMVALSHLKGHLETHNPNRPRMTCPHCPKEFITRKLFKAHINAIHTQEIKYTCDKCGKVYLRSNSLREHILSTHSEEKRYQCRFCDEKFVRTVMRNHHEKRVHSTLRPYACEYCEKAFKFRSDLTIHTRIHTGEKPFECDICGKRFNKSYNVVIHKKSHRNDPR